MTGSGGGAIKFPGGAGFGYIAAPLLSFLLYLSVFFLPLFGWMLNFLAPLPLVYYFFTHGRMSAQIAVLGATAAIALAFGYKLSFFYLFSYGLLALALAEQILRKAFLGHAVLTAALVAISATSVFLWITFPVPFSEFYSLLMEQVQFMMSQTIASYEKAGVSQEQIDFLGENSEFIAMWLIYILPATASVGYLILSLGNYLAYKTIQKRWTFLPPTDPNPISSWTPPEKMVFAVIFAGGMTLFQHPFIRPLGVNLLILFGAVYLFVGLCVMQSFIVKYKIPNFIRWALYILILLQPFLLVGVASLGLSDLWFDHRKLRTNDEKGKEE